MLRNLIKIQIHLIFTFFEEHFHLFSWYLYSILLDGWFCLPICWLACNYQFMCEILISSFIYIPSLQLGQLGIFLNHPPSVVCQHPCAHMNSSSQGFEWLLKRWDFIHIQYNIDYQSSCIILYDGFLGWLTLSLAIFPSGFWQDTGHWNDVGTTAAFNFNVDYYCKQRDICIFRYILAKNIKINYLFYWPARRY